MRVRTTPATPSTQSRASISRLNGRHHDNTIAARGFDTLSLFTCQSLQSAIIGPIKINELSERYNRKMASSPPLLN